MTWPTTQVASNDHITPAQINGLPARVGSVTLGAPAAAFDFLLFPSNYAHYMITLLTRGDTAANTAAIRLRFNADNASVYYSQYTYGNSAGAAAGEFLGQTDIAISDTPAGNALSGTFGQTVIYLPNLNQAGYHGAVSRVLDPYGASAGQILAGTWAGFYNVLTSIYRIQIYPAAGNFAAASEATLYGLP